jgi:hypothetical protein
MGHRTKGLWIAVVAVGLSGCGVKTACGGDSVDCGGTCVTPLADNLNCGACGNVCGVGTTCLDGRCEVPCPAGQLACGGACVDPQTSATYCGASGDCTGANAGATCAAGETCQAGSCGRNCTPVVLDLDTPFATDPPPFAPRHGQQSPTSLWASSVPPLPTNTSWQNLVLGDGGLRIDFLPYQL